MHKVLAVAAPGDFTLRGLGLVNGGQTVTGPPQLSGVAAEFAVYGFDCEPVVHLLHLFSRFHPEARVLYVHTKGASRPVEHESVHDWRRYLLYQVVDRFRDCLEALRDHDAAGCDVREWPARHFSGNFWWARAPHLATLRPPAANDRYGAEQWVLSGDARVLQLHDSGRDHYIQRYLPEEYARGG